MVAYASYGSGRVVVIGDSSVAEDITPNSGTTYNGWIQPIGGVADGDDGTLVTNATLWLEEPDVIINTVAEDLAACPDQRGIFLTSAGVLPPLVSLEKARTVAEQLKKLKI